MNKFSDSTARLICGALGIFLFFGSVAYLFNGVPTKIRDYHAYTKAAREAFARSAPPLGSVEEQMTDASSVFHEINAAAVLANSAFHVEKRLNNLSTKRVIIPVFDTISAAEDRRVAATLVFKNERELKKWKRLPHPHKETVLQSFTSIQLQGVVAEEPEVQEPSYHFLLRHGYKLDTPPQEIRPFLTPRETALKRYTRTRYGHYFFMPLVGILMLAGSLFLCRIALKPRSAPPEPRKKKHKHRK